MYDTCLCFILMFVTVITMYSDVRRVPAINRSFFFFQADGTFETQSQFEFVASRFDDESVLSCEGANAVMHHRNEILRETVKLEVFCKLHFIVFALSTFSISTFEIIVFMVGHAVFKQCDIHLRFNLYSKC